MGKSIPSSPRLQDFARIITSDRIHQQSKRGPKSISSKTRVVPPPEPAKPKGIRIVQSEKQQQQRLKIMEENSSVNRRIPLSEVVVECSKRWFQDTLKEAKAGDISMQVLVGQMYSSGYGVVKDAQKGFQMNGQWRMEEEAERKIGWFFKLIFAGTATIIGYNIFPYLGDNLIQQSVSLLNVKDPLFKRMGASRLTRFATDDEQRMKIVEMGGAQKLVEMLGAATDDQTRKEALTAIVAIARSDEAAGALHSAGAISVIMATPPSTEDAEIENFKVKLLKRFQDLKKDEKSS